METITKALLFLLSAIQIPSAYLAMCPGDVVTSVFSCLSNVSGTPGNVPLAGGDIQILQNNCRNGGFGHVLQCVDFLLHNCRSEKDLEVLAKLVHRGNLQTAFTEICKGMELYENSSQCMKSQDPFIHSCIHLEYETFARNTQKINTPDRLQEVLPRYCAYTKGVARCIESYIRKGCNHEIADLLARFMAGLTAPMCSSALCVTPFPIVIFLLLVTVFLTPVLLSKAS